MGRSPCCSKEGLNRGAWTASEDKTLSTYIKGHGEGKWRDLPKRAGLKRCGKSCRLRWLNYLRPDIKRGNISKDEEELIIRLHKLLGNSDSHRATSAATCPHGPHHSELDDDADEGGIGVVGPTGTRGAMGVADTEDNSTTWSLIAGRLPGRTDNEIKNYWNTTLGKRFHDQKSSPQPQEQTTCHPSNDNPAITPIDEPKTSAKPVIIRTKAIRCKKVVVSTLPSSSSPPSPQPPPHQQPHDHNITNPSPDQDPVPILMDQDFLINYLQPKDQDFDFDFLNYDKCDEYFQSGGGDGDAILQGDRRDHYNNNLSFLENNASLFKVCDVDGIGTSTGFENGANLDLESLSVLLDISREWP